MKRLMLVLCLLSHKFSFSQGYLKGDVVAGASIGMPHLYKYLQEVYMRTEKFKSSFKGSVEVVSITGTNPIALKYEYALAKNFGLGLSVAWWSYEVNVNDHYDQVSGSNVYHRTDNYKVRYRSTSFGIRPNYHFPVRWKKADLYMGCALGLTKNQVTINFSSTGSSFGQFYEGGAPLSLYLAPSVGCRFFLMGNFGLNVEAGFEKGALLQAGIVFRFRPFHYEPPK